MGCGADDCADVPKPANVAASGSPCDYGQLWHGKYDNPSFGKKFRTRHCPAVSAELGADRRRRLAGHGLERRIGLSTSQEGPPLSTSAHLRQASFGRAVAGV